MTRSDSDWLRDLLFSCPEARTGGSGRLQLLITWNWGMQVVRVLLVRFWIARGIPVNNPGVGYLFLSPCTSHPKAPSCRMICTFSQGNCGECVRTCGATLLRSMPVQCSIPLPVNRALVNFTLHRSLLESQSQKNGSCSRIVPCFSARSGPVPKPLAI